MAIGADEETAIRGVDSDLGAVATIMWDNDCGAQCP